MSSSEQSSEQLLPSAEVMKQQIDAKFAELKRKPLDGQVIAAMDALQQAMPELQDPEALKSINGLLGSAAEMFASMDPVRLTTLLDRVQAHVVSEDFNGLNSPELRKLLQAPTGTEKTETAEGAGGTIEKLMAMLEKMGKTLSALGSGTLATIEKFCGGPDTVFGKIFGSLKDLPESQRVYLVKEIRKRNLNLSPETNMVKIVDTMRTQVVAVRDEEQINLGTQTYDFLKHCDSILPLLAAKKEPLTEIALQKIGEDQLAKTKIDLKKKGEALAIKPQTATAQPTAAAATPTERTRTRVEGTPSELKVSPEGSDKVTVVKTEKKVAFQINGKTLTVNQDIKSVDLLAAQGAQKGTVELVMTDDTKLTIQADEIVAKSKTTDGKVLLGLKTTATNPEAIEVPITLA